MPTLHISLLGPPQFMLDNTPVSFSYSRARSLLAYLALAGEIGLPHRRESLIALLWPDAAETAARTNFRQVLASLREALRDSAQPEPFVVSERETVQLNPRADIRIDVRAFEQILTADLPPPGRALERLPRLARQRVAALALYRGEFFAGLSGNESPEFEAWVTAWRERCHQLALEASAGYARHVMLLGDMRAAFPAWQRVLSLQAWHEEAHAAIMTALAAVGDRAAALKQFEFAQAGLLRELGIAPGTVLRDTYDAIAHDEAPNPSPVPAVRTTVALYNASALIGRETQLLEIDRALEQRERRLITLHGLGGCGKTRLASEVVRRNVVLCEDGVAFVSLAESRDCIGALSEIAATLGTKLASDVSVEQSVCDALAQRDLLLVLDNAEHLLPNLAGVVARLIAHAPKLTVLVTSRSTLGLRSEWVLPVTGLQHTAADAGAAGALYLQRAAQAGHALPVPDQVAIARLCAQLDGLPLGIELAASLLPQHHAAAIASALEQDNDLLAAAWPDAPERQRSISALFEYSWRALDAMQQNALAALSVCIGAFERDAAIAVGIADSELLDQLASHALIQTAVHVDVQRAALHPLLRQFAAHKLVASGLQAEAKTRHLAHFSAQAARYNAVDTGEKAQLRQTLRADLANFRAAIEHAIERKQVTETVALAIALSSMAFQFGQMPEITTHIDSANTMLSQLFLTVEVLHGRAVLRHYRGTLAALQDDLVQADTHLRAALDLARRAEDDVLLARVLSSLSRNDADRGQFETAYAFATESARLCAETHDAVGAARAQMTLAEVAGLMSRTDDAKGHYAMAIPLLESLGAHEDLAIAIGNLGMIEIDTGDLDNAHLHLEACLAIAQRYGFDYVTAAVNGPLGDIYLRFADQAHATVDRATALRRAQALTQQALRDTHAQGLKLFRASAFLQIGSVALHAGDAERAATLLGAAEMARALSDAPWQPGHQAGVSALGDQLTQKLDPAAYAAAYAAGHAMSLDDALAFALDALNSA